MGFWIFSKSGELDYRFKVVKDGKTALYSLLAIAVVCFVIFYFIYLYLFVLLPLVLSLACYQYSSKTFKTAYAISISLLFLCIYSILLGIMTGQDNYIIFGNYKFKGAFKMYKAVSKHLRYHFLFICGINCFWGICVFSTSA